VVPEPLQQRVGFALSWVLNPLSHSESIERHSREVKDAPDALEGLSVVVQEAIAQKGQHEALARSTLLSALIQKPETVDDVTYDI
jgi:chromosome condensin MukBEF ATPase and DNA-binding subunit MukB